MQLIQSSKYTIWLFYYMTIKICYVIIMVDNSNHHTVVQIFFFFISLIWFREKFDHPPSPKHPKKKKKKNWKTIQFCWCNFLGQEIILTGCMLDIFGFYLCYSVNSTVSTTHQFITLYAKSNKSYEFPYAEGKRSPNLMAKIESFNLGL